MKFLLAFGFVYLVVRGVALYQAQRRLEREFAEWQRALSKDGDK